MYNPNDYAGETFEANERLARAAAERREDEKERERDEQHARDMAFIETPYCGAACFEHSLHADACNTLNADPIAAALNGWLGAVAIAMKEAA